MTSSAITIAFASQIPPEGQAGAGEVYIRPLGADSDRRDMATVVVTHGIENLLRGEGPLQRIMIPCDTTRPTLDDMLAAAFVQRLLRAEKLPAAADAFARYAALAREGLQPGDMPMDSSMEGIFLALRNNAGDDLTNAAVARRFLADWDRLARFVFEAADAGKDPFVTNLFEESSDFARERAFLKKDEHVYLEDVRRGRHWVVQIPGGPRSSAMLLLEKPRSLLWKYWSRRDSTAPAGGSYLLLVVNWGDGNWVISTDPVQRLGIRPLAEKLQEAESRKDSASAGQDPWFDGAPFGHTLVAAPKGGTKLTDRQVLAIIKRWAKAKSVVGLNRMKRFATVIGGTLGTVATAIFIQFLLIHFMQPKSLPPTSSPSPVRATTTP